MKYPHMSTDFYKWSHIDQYVVGTKKVYSNFTPRSNRLANVIRTDGKMVYFGIQYALQYLTEVWDQNFFSKKKETVVKRFARRVETSIGSDHGKSMIDAIGKLHDLGYLPIEVRSLKEGSRVNMGIPLFVISNTHDDFFWIVNYLETYLSAIIWPMCNAAVVSEQYYITARKYGAITNADPFWYEICQHFFAARGNRGFEDATITAMGHMVFSSGTDAGWAIDYIEDYYDVSSDDYLIGCSVNASEHATSTQRIAYWRNVLKSKNPERESVKDLLTKVYPSGVFSYVADSEDYFRFISSDLLQLKDIILNRQPDNQGLVKFVVRPDSSPKTPLEIIVGDPEATDIIERKGTLQVLWEIFGGTINERGFKVLDPKIGLIYGEAIDQELQIKIYEKMIEHGWCVSNLLMGVGSWGFLKNASRDSFSMAIKGTHSEVDDSVFGHMELSMQKNPKTATNSKKSARGLLVVTKDGDDFVLHEDQSVEMFESEENELKLIFKDGKFTKRTNFKEIRELARTSAEQSYLSL